MRQPFALKTSAYRGSFRSSFTTPGPFTTPFSDPPIKTDRFFRVSGDPSLSPRERFTIFFWNRLLISPLTPPNALFTSFYLLDDAYASDFSITFHPTTADWLRGWLSMVTGASHWLLLIIWPRLQSLFGFFADDTVVIERTWLFLKVRQPVEALRSSDVTSIMGTMANGWMRDCSWTLPRCDLQRFLLPIIF